jgi:hypothetical protein
MRSIRVRTTENISMRDNALEVEVEEWIHRPFRLGTATKGSHLVQQLGAVL